MRKIWEEFYNCIKIISRYNFLIFVYIYIYMWITGVGYLDERHFVHRGESATKWRILAFRRPLVRSELMMMIQISETWLYGGNGVPVGWHLEPRCLSRYIRITVCPWRVVHSSGNQAVKQRLRCHRVCYTTLTCLLWWDANDISVGSDSQHFEYPEVYLSLHFRYGYRNFPNLSRYSMKRN